jgi:hypothetical protein
MRLYVIVTALVFALIGVAHGARIVLEGPGPLSDPVFVGASALTLGLAAWAVVLLRRS